MNYQSLGFSQNKQIGKLPNSQGLPPNPMDPLNKHKARAFIEQPQFRIRRRQDSAKRNYLFSSNQMHTLIK